MRMIYRIALVAAVSCTFFTTAAFAVEREISVDQLPAAVKATLQQKAGDATVSEIELEEKNGSSFYSVELKKDEKESEITIAPDGRFLGQEVEDDDDEKGDHEEESEDEETVVQLANTPPGVQATIKAFPAGGALKGITSEKEHGVTVYEAEYDVKGEEQSLKISADGAVLEVEQTLDVNDLPAAVTSALNKKFPQGTVKKAEAVELHLIEVKITTDDGKTHEVKLTPAGAFAKSEDED